MTGRSVGSANARKLGKCGPSTTTAPATRPYMNATSRLWYVSEPAGKISKL